LLCGDDAGAHDLVQEAFVSVLARRAAAESDLESIEAFVKRVIINRSIDEHRRRMRWTQRAHLLAKTSPSDDLAEGAALRGDVLQAVHCLTRRQRACIVLYYYDDRPVAEIADILGCSAGTVKRQLSDARARLALSPAFTTGSEAE